MVFQFFSRLWEKLSSVCWPIMRRALSRNLMAWERSGMCFHSKVLVCSRCIQKMSARQAARKLPIGKPWSWCSSVVPAMKYELSSSKLIKRMSSGSDTTQNLWLEPTFRASLERSFRSLAMRMVMQREWARTVSSAAITAVSTAGLSRLVNWFLNIALDEGDGTVSK
jgi:hypothetical protein